MIVVGIDPGKTGGIARLDTLVNQITFWAQPLDREGKYDEWTMRSLVQQLAISGAELMVLETFVPSPSFFGGKGRSTHQQSMAYGMWRSTLASFFTKEQVIRVAAVTWKTRMQVTVPIIKAGKVATKEERDAAYEQRKIKAVRTAIKLFPNNEFITKRGRMMDGEAEAALLAKYGAEQLAKIEPGLPLA